MSTDSQCSEQFGLDFDSIDDFEQKKSICHAEAKNF